MLKRSCFLDKREGLGGVDAILARFSRDINLNQHIYFLVYFLETAIHFPNNFHAIDRLDHRSKLHDFIHFVTLKMTDEMPFKITFAITQNLYLLLGLLDTVFANPIIAEVGSFQNGFHRICFSGWNTCNRIRVSAAFSAGRENALLYLLYITLNSTT